MTAFNLGNLGLIVDRPGATPAPTAGPGDRPVPTGPWQPTVQPPFTVAADPAHPYGVDPALVDGYLHITPDTVGLADDPIAHALHHLAPFGDLTLAGAVQALGAWPGSGRLTAAQVAEVLAYYRPARLRAVA